jgi:hypothetical protein
MEQVMDHLVLRGWVALGSCSREPPVPPGVGAGSVVGECRALPHELNQVERWFSLLTDKLLRRGVHTSVQALEHAIRTWIDTWNTNPRAFTSTETADEILASLADYLPKIRKPNPD